ncbi:MAG: hypothetical protein CM15mP83_5410 [Flavobacteriaceae bacterium]|nr:MAG: hypothetical protein CM15mP83_5410 [Flavobacteriaceae bacterium]
MGLDKKFIGLSKIDKAQKPPIQSIFLALWETTKRISRAPNGLKQGFLKTIIKRFFQTKKPKLMASSFSVVGRPQMRKIIFFNAHGKRTQHFQIGGPEMYRPYNHWFRICPVISNLKNKSQGEHRIFSDPPPQGI